MPRNHLFFLFEVISFVSCCSKSKGRPKPKTVSLVALSAADHAPVNLNGTKTLLVNYLSTLFINGKITFINGLRSLPRNLLIKLF